MQPFKFIPVDENEVIADAVVAHHELTTWWQIDEIRHALEPGDLDRAADLSEQMSDSDYCIFD